MAAISRGTPSFALPATQNTAPVHEFRCLYTHDIRKKVKKWHDGSARFHTFNRRVMVYDDTKNYIGDLHYRADEEFGEGIELQLDRGVMVEVGELVGQTQTDLTGVIHRPQADVVTSSIASANPGPRPFQRVNHLNTEGRPKSLSELLGPSQGRSGRAKLPLASPFEQRQILLDVQQNERPSKRPKLAAGKENRHSLEHSIVPAQSRDKSSPAGPIISSPALSTVRHQQHLISKPISTKLGVQPTIIDISSDEEALATPKPSVDRYEKNTEQTVEHIGVQRKVSKTTVNKSSERRAENIRQKNSLSAKPRGGLASTSTRLSADAGAASSSSLRPGMSSLKMRSQEPRRKMMYRALIPSAETIRGEELETLTNQERRSFDNFHQESDQNTADIPPENSSAIAVEADELGGTFPSVHSTPRSNEACETPTRPASPRNTVQHSPLFVSQTASQRSPTPVRTLADDVFNMIGTQDILGHAKSATIATTESLGPLEADEDGIIEPESPCFPYPPPRTEPKEHSTAITIVPLEVAPILPSEVTVSVSVQRTPSPVKARLLTRSLSTNDYPLPYDPRASPARQPPQPVQPRFSPAALPLPNTELLRNKRGPTKSPFQRCRSDTAAIVPTVTADTTSPLTTTMETVGPDEQGPWTRLEAFLLFDQWPKCKRRNKPVFPPLRSEEQETEEDGMSLDDDDDDDDNNNKTGFIPATRALRNKGPQPSVLIRSARAVWRDGQLCM